MSYYKTASLTTGSITAGDTVVVSVPTVNSNININKIKIVPDIAAGAQTISIHRKSTALYEDLVYGTIPYVGNLIDPIENISGTLTERNGGFVCTFENLDLVNLIYIKIYNAHSSAKMYQIDITYSIVGEDSLSVKIFGALGNGTTDDTAAILAADTAAGTTGTIYISKGTYLLSNNLTLVSHVKCDGIFSIASGKTLTINGPFEAGFYQVFSGAGSVKFGFGSVPEIPAIWFGAVGDSNMTAGNGTDNAVAIQKAMDSATDDDVDPRSRTIRTVKLLTGKYRIGSGLQMRNRVTLQGSGKDTTYLYGNEANINAITFGAVANAWVKGMTIYKTGSTSGSGILLSGNIIASSGTEDVQLRMCFRGIYLTGTVVNWKGVRPTFAANYGASLELSSSAVTGGIDWNNANFEGTQAEHVKCAGTSTAHGMTFSGITIFESSEAANAVDLGQNASSYYFEHPLFENNGGTNATAYDINIGAGGSNIMIDNATFAPPSVGVTNFWSINLAYNVTPIIIRNHQVSNAITGNYKGFLNSDLHKGILLIGGKYGTTGNYITGRSTPYTLMDTLNPDAWSTDGQTTSLKTTGATPTRAWGRFYTDQDLGTYKGYFIEASILGIKDDGSQACAYKRNALITKLDTANPNVIGTGGDYSIETDAGLEAAIGLNGNDIEISVTGIAGTNIQWVVSVKLTYVKW